jgi:hypothetical protein
MCVVRFLRRLRVALTPPGTRGSLDSTYRQPKVTGTYVPSPHEHDTRGG